MKLRIVLALLAAMALWVASYSASAQNRPPCDPDPAHPGACFYTQGAGGGIVCDDGFIFTAVEEGKRSIGRINPNGTRAIHTTEGTLPALACTTADFLAGICVNPDGTLGPGVYLGEVSLQANGFLTEGGGASCPFKSTLRGVLFRDVGLGPEEVEIDAVLHTVKDPKEPAGCRIQLCRVFADGQ